MRVVAVAALVLAVAVVAPALAQETNALPSGAARVHELDEVEVLPRPQNLPEFMAALRTGYPPHLRTAGLGGTVQVEFVVHADGQPGEVRVLSTPDSSLGAPTVQAVSLLRFEPAQVQGQPVPVRVVQPITWRAEAPPADTGAAGAPAAAHAAAPDSVQGYELSHVDEFPRPRNLNALRREMLRLYPPALFAAGRGGMVQVRFRVKADGTVDGVAVTAATEPALLRPSLEVVRILRFSPGRKNGRPVPVWVELPLRWDVTGAPPNGQTYERDRGNFRPPPPPCAVQAC